MQLGKAGGYTATVNFISPLVNQGNVNGSTIIEKGCDGGGSIAVYANTDDANKRNDYLSAFDGDYPRLAPIAFLARRDQDLRRIYYKPIKNNLKPRSQRRLRNSNRTHRG